MDSAPTKGAPCRLDERQIRCLYERYEAGESITALNIEVGYKPGGLRATFNRRGLPSLGKTAKVELTDPRAERAIELWDRGMKTNDCAREVGISDALLRRLLRDTGRGEELFQRALGPQHPRWAGGRRVAPNGYVTVWMSQADPLVAMRRQDGTALEHRMVMARHLGHALSPHQTVHHKNGIRHDNRLENLELRIGHHGQGAAMRCSDCGSVRIEAVALAESERDENDA